MTTQEREAFAKRCETTRGHMQNVAYGKPCSPKLATAVWRDSEGVVTREELRPKDYWLIWPDLPAPTPKAKARKSLPKAAEAA